MREGAHTKYANSHEQWAPVSSVPLYHKEFYHEQTRTNTNKLSEYKFVAFGVPKVRWFSG